ELEEQYGTAFETPPTASWLLAADAFPEIHRQAGQERERFLGSIAIRGEAGELQAAANNESTLMSAIQCAAGGDQRALRVVKNNVGTDLAERLFKSAHQTRVRMQISQDNMHQEGRNITDLHRNALEHTVLVPEMLRRTTIELQNGLLFPLLYHRGVFKTHDAVIFSTSPTKMSLTQKKAYNFFADTETCSIQRLSAEGGDMVLETAFVAGKRTPGSERHDIQVIRRLAAERGIELPSSDGTDMLGFVFLIPKHELSGVEDIVRWYDDAAGGTFYGEEKPRQDYKQYALQCEERSSSFSDTVQAITSQLISEAHTFQTALDANLRLDELSQQHSVKRAVRDVSINEAVFGKEAAMHIQEARFFIDRGEFDRAEQAEARAQATADSGSCPWLKNLLSGEGDQTDPSGSESSQSELSEKRRGKCPYCGITVFVDPCAKRIACWDCSALVVDGKVISKGNGGSSKRRAEAKDAGPPLVLLFGVSKLPPVEPKKGTPKFLPQQVDDAFTEQGVGSFETEQHKVQSQRRSGHAGQLALVGAAAEA
ncbi:MAG TPA: hypothetical protein VFM05_04245, partial [Candidatus Saccharimonadales bacterium]|nr:hypothetical protein [Candidatus Saccharimonadales bacterium]